MMYLRYYQFDADIIVEEHELIYVFICISNER